MASNLSSLCRARANQVRMLCMCMLYVCGEGYITASSVQVQGEARENKLVAAWALPGKFKMPKTRSFSGPDEAALRGGGAAAHGLRPGNSHALSPPFDAAALPGACSVRSAVYGAKCHSPRADALRAAQMAAAMTTALLPLLARPTRLLLPRPSSLLRVVEVHSPATAPVHT